MKRLTIIKIGGNIVDKPEALQCFLNNFQKAKGPKILVHGGGTIATDLSKKLGIEVKMYNGRRITDYETLKLVTMVYAGLINKQIVASLQKIGCNAIGLSGVDADCVPANKREIEQIDWGYVGDVNPSEINTSFLNSLLDRGLIPVFSAITHDRNGSLLNTNADTLASNIAIAMSEEYTVKLVYCFEKQGVLLDYKDENSVIKIITEKSYKNLLVEKRVKEGMIPKLDNAFKALNSGVNEVIIKHADNLLNDKETVLKK
jgi:acetylglutamate kinase